MAKATDHLGQGFKSQNDMCRYWGIAPSLYTYRIRHGWTKERALTTRKERNVFDHKGNEYPNTEELCRAYSISRDCFEYRIKQKWSLCDALTTPVEEKRISKKYRCRDRDGITYASQSQMCVAHKTSRGVFNYRRRRNTPCFSYGDTPKPIRSGRLCKTSLGQATVAELRIPSL